MKRNGNPEPLDLRVLIEKEGKLYSALCLELDVASQGRSIAKAKKNVIEAIELYLESVYDAGEEKEFISRPAPVEEWVKYFEAMTKRMSKSFRASATRREVRLRELVYAP